MSEQCKPRLVVSRCLGFEACRYNAQMIADDLIKRLQPFVEMITVCPEADIGLGTPRDPVRLVQVDKKVRMLQPATGADVTDLMHDYIGIRIKAFVGVDGFLMKGRSPSCGPSVVKVITVIRRVVRRLREWACLRMLWRRRFRMQRWKMKGG